MCEIWRSQLEPKDVIDPDTVKHFPVKSCLQPGQGGFAPWLIALSAGILLQLLLAPAAGVAEGELPVKPSARWGGWHRGDVFQSGTEYTWGKHPGEGRGGLFAGTNLHSWEGTE